MLEDPSYSQVVRWGDDMDSFVVLEVYPHRSIVHAQGVGLTVS